MRVLDKKAGAPWFFFCNGRKPRPLPITIKYPHNYTSFQAFIINLAETKAKFRPPPLKVNDPSLEKEPASDEKKENPISEKFNKSHDRYSEEIQRMDYTPKQKKQLEEYLKCRELIGDLTNEDLSVEGELGSGNGGVVLKVRHRRTGIDLAKKVK